MHIHRQRDPTNHTDQPYKQKSTHLEELVADAADGVVLRDGEVGQLVVVAQVRRVRVAVLVRQPLAGRGLVVVTGMSVCARHDRWTRASEPPANQPTKAHQTDNSLLGEVRVARAHVLVLDVLPAAVDVVAVRGLEKSTRAWV